MCGIVAVLRRPSRRRAPTTEEVLARIERAAATLSRSDVLQGPGLLDSATSELADADRELRGTPGLRCLLGPGVVEALRAPLDSVGGLVRTVEASLDTAAEELSPRDYERVSFSFNSLKDAWWAIAHDRLGLAASVEGLLGGRVGEKIPDLDGLNLDGWWSIAVALAAIDRLEVRGRDSAGIHIMVSGFEPDERSQALMAARVEEAGTPVGELFVSGALRAPKGALSFVYKAASEIGELGDNVRALRAAIVADALLGPAIGDPGAMVSVVAHTRWASVGIISEPNAHPLNSDELGRREGPYVIGALNGDVDNHVELRTLEGLAIPPEITTDAKIIPALVSRRLDKGLAMDDAFRETVRGFEGSVAIAAASALGPDELHLALCGSGQSLNIGLAEDAFVVASEPYGLVEETSDYVRMDGEATRGQIVALSADLAGTLQGIRRYRYSGESLPVSGDEVVRAEMTTRDVDRRGYDHFLLKELTEAPSSFRKTLRGHVVERPDGLLTVRVGDDSIPPALAALVAGGGLRRILVVGQGTAAVAGQAVAAAISHCLPSIPVVALPATELSGFGLADDMADSLVVAISQSGTTTDTNRTVDLVRTRGAHVLGVVNRRNSDLASKVHGVFHTSDGRDVEMSVASTKAFYSQVAAGWLLAGALSTFAPPGTAVSAAELDSVLRGLRAIPEAMEKLLARRGEIARAAQVVAPPRRYWAVVGSGPDRIAASEVRIKLSELCYRSISTDATEDKKHIDLSCEPLIVVCAAGLRGANADDVAKEVAIYRAHKALPVVICTEGEGDRFTGPTGEVIEVPTTDPAVGFVLSAMVGHLFGYEAALAIDNQARPLREARAAIERSVAAEQDPDAVMQRVSAELEHSTAPFHSGLGSGAYDGNLDASTAVRIVSRLRYATGSAPLEGYEGETGRIGTPAALLSDLLEALSKGIDELTRPIDAIKHQAKTVTVGISRSEEALFGAQLVRAALAAGPSPDSLGYRALRTLEALDEAVAEVLGYTRYRVETAPSGLLARVSAQGGVAKQIRSRTESDPRLLGTKHRAAQEREVTVARGASDGRTVVIIPESRGTQVSGLTLLHVRFHDSLRADRAKAVLSGYRTRYSALTDAVTETEPVFDETLLSEVPIADLLTQPVYDLAEHWRTRR
jgi:glucosamine--fructose-6-phosphate aminotransferase (isomerizing)